jgi:glycosyltransferase involved in cell wall biosynthesis
MKNNMRILHIHKYNHERDGVGRYMHDIMRLSDAEGHATAVLAMHHPKNLPSPWEHFFISALETEQVGRGVHAFRQLGRALWSREAYKKTMAMIAAFQPDVIHAHNVYTHLSPAVLSAAKRCGVPVVLTAHDYGYISANYGLFDGREPISPRASWIEVARTRCIKQSFVATAVSDAIVRLQKSMGMWTQNVSHILTASETVKRALQEGGYAASRIEVIPLPSGAFAYHERKTKRVTRRKAVLFASRFETYKGIDVFLELAARMPDVEFICAGHGSEEAYVRNVAMKRKNILLQSMLSPKMLWSLMEEVSAVIVPSRWSEPFGLVALEALTVGTPAIVSNQGGLSEIVEHGVSGFVEHPDALDAWERDIRLLLPEGEKKPARIQEMQEQARARGREVGDPRKHMKALFAVYQEAIHQKDTL